MPLIVAALQDKSLSTRAVEGAVGAVANLCKALLQGAEQRTDEQETGKRGDSEPDVHDAGWKGDVDKKDDVDRTAEERSEVRDRVLRAVEAARGVEALCALLAEVRWVTDVWWAEAGGDSEQGACTVIDTFGVSRKQR